MRKTAKHKGFRKFPKRRKRINNVSVKKRVYERARSKTRIYIGVAFERWRHLRQLKGMKTDAELALFLLDGQVVLPFCCFHHNGELKWHRVELLEQRHLFNHPSCGFMHCVFTAYALQKINTHQLFVVLLRLNVVTTDII